MADDGVFFFFFLHAISWARPICGLPPQHSPASPFAAFHPPARTLSMTTGWLVNTSSNSDGMLSACRLLDGGGAKLWYSGGLPSRRGWESTATRTRDTRLPGHCLATCGRPPKVCCCCCCCGAGCVCGIAVWILSARWMDMDPVTTRREASSKPQARSKWPMSERSASPTARRRRRRRRRCLYAPTRSHDAQRAQPTHNQHMHQPPPARQTTARALF